MAYCPRCNEQFDAGVSVCPHDGSTLLPEHALGARERDLEPGDMAGDYEIEAKLGTGGFGTVYRATHPVIGKRAAIKVLRGQYSSNPSMVTRFISEARAVNQIRQRNIVDIFAFGTLPDGRHWFAMELLEGRPLDVLLDSVGRFHASQTLAILGPIARALDAAHAANIIHRDLKPDNVIISHDDEGHVLPKLLDFGIAKLLNAGASGPQTHTGAPIGTPVYMSPEQCRGTKVDHRSDVYSLGVMAFEMLTGTRPFGGETAMDVLMGHMQRTPPTPSTVWSGLDSAFDEPVLRMLAKNPDDRPASPTAAVAELEEAARSVGIDVDAAALSREAIASVPSLRSRQEASTLEAGKPGKSGGTAESAGTGRSADTGKSVDADAPTEAAVEPISSASGTLEPASALTGAGGSTVGSSSRVASRGRNLAIGAVALGLLATVAFLGLRQGGEPPAVEGASTSKSAMADLSTSDGDGAPVAGGSAIASSEGAASAPPTVSASAEPTTVSITVHTMPPGAEVLLGTQVLGAAPGPFELQRTDSKQRLTVRSPGYRPAQVEVTPTAAAALSVQLKPAAAKPPPVGALPPELEY